MKIRTLAVLVVITALCCAGCLQELPLGDKYINEAVGFLQVQNTSADASYIITAVELRNDAGETIRTWDGLALKPGEIWTGDMDLEGSFILYCTVQNTVEETVGTFNHGEVEIKLHAVVESKIPGEVYLSTADTDGDGFSDFRESKNGFDPNDPGDGGTVYVSAVGSDDNRGTKASPYKSLAAGVEKAKWGLDEKIRTVVVLGHLNRVTEGARSTGTAVVSIADTGPHGITIEGEDSALIDAGSNSNDRKRALYLAPGTKLTLKNITITGGFAYRGGGVHADGAELTLGEGAMIQGCWSAGGTYSGAAIYASGGALVVMESGSLIGGDKDKERNIAGRGEGGAIGLYNGSSLVMKAGSLIKGNSSNWGGAVSADLESRVTLEAGAEISGNTSYMNSDKSTSVSHGGGLRITGRSTLLMEGKITGNTVKNGGGGGGVYVSGDSKMEMKGGEISGNTANEEIKDGENTIIMGNGGGIYVEKGGIFSMSGGIIASNAAKGQGGGVYIDGGSFAKTGGTVYGSTGSKNTAGEADKTGNGHALYATTTPVTFRDNTLSDSDSFTL
jgi:hypothetical protein